jgi:hypothetical protein
MVEIGQCYRTKYGSIHETEAEAKEAELKEDVRNFSKYFASAFFESSNCSGYAHMYKIAEELYDKRNIVVELIKDYNFIKQ